MGRRLGLEGLVHVPLGTRADARERERQRAVGVLESEMRGREGALRQADDMRLGDPQMVQHVAHIADGVLLAVLRGVVGYVRARVAAERIGDAAVPAREEAHLRLPAAEIAAILVHEKDRRAGAHLLIVKLHAIRCCRLGHRRLPSVRA